jgi:hypothetical protein
MTGREIKDVATGTTDLRLRANHTDKGDIELDL